MGRPPWAEQWIEQGSIANARESVVEALAARFEQVPEGLRERIHGIGDLVVLRELHKVAVTAESLEAFRSSAGL